MTAHRDREESDEDEEEEEEQEEQEEADRQRQPRQPRQPRPVVAQALESKNIPVSLDRRGGGAGDTHRHLIHFEHHTTHSKYS